MCRFIVFAVAMLVVNGRQAHITTSASASAVHPGQRITLTIDVDLRPGVHVYAPGAEGYIPISWTLEDSPAYKAQDVEMPAPRKLYLQAIDETVPAYEGRIRLVRGVTIGPAAANRLTIDGALRYQACDDQMCYKPEKLPLQWTFTIERR
jgi:DsbC/DsbD-like thiol-disulfide interchange protein